MQLQKVRMSEQREYALQMVLNATTSAVGLNAKDDDGNGSEASDSDTED